MNILKQSQEEIALRLTNTLKTYTISQLAKAYGCKDNNMRARIKDLSKPEPKTKFGTIKELHKAIDKLEEV